ncbi:septum formation initiator family protein [Verrucomicrobiota bacterium]
MRLWVTICRSGIVILAVLFVIAVICFFMPKCNKLRQMHEQKIEDRKEIKEMETKITRVTKNRERFKNDPTFVEHTAREIGKVKPNETVFIFTNKQSQVTNEQ